MTFTIPRLIKWHLPRHKNAIREGGVLIVVDVLKEARSRCGAVSCIGSGFPLVDFRDTSVGFTAAGDRSGRIAICTINGMAARGTRLHYSQTVRNLAHRFHNRIEKLFIFNVITDNLVVFVPSRIKEEKLLGSIFVKYLRLKRKHFNCFSFVWK